MCAGARLDGRRVLQHKSAELGRVKCSYGPVPIKTDLTPSYCVYLETSAIVAKHELKLSSKSVQILQ